MRGCKLGLGLKHCKKGPGSLIPLTGLQLYIPLNGEMSDHGPNGRAFDTKSPFAWVASGLGSLQCMDSGHGIVSEGISSLSMANTDSTFIIFHNPDVVAGSKHLMSVQNTDREWRLLAANDSTQAWPSLDGSSYTSAELLVRTGFEIEKWSMSALTWVNSTRRWDSYVCHFGGSVDGTGRTLSVTPDNGGEFIFGDTDSGVPYDGQMLEVSAWSRALTIPELQAIADGVFAGKPLAA